MMCFAEELTEERKDDLENGILFVGLNGHAQTIFWGDHIPFWLVQEGTGTPYSAASRYATATEIAEVEKRYGFPEGFLSYQEITSSLGHLKTLSGWYKELDSKSSREIRESFAAEMPYEKTNIATRMLDQREKDPLGFLKEF